MQSPLRVLHLVTSFAVGGGEALVLGVASQMSREQFEPHIGVLRELSGKSLRPEFEQLGLPIKSFRAGRIYNLRSIRAIVDYIRANHIEVLHTHLLVADIHGRIAGRLTGIPVVSTLQNEPRGFADLRFDRRLLEQLTARFLTTQLVAVSEFVRQRFIDEWKLPGDQIEVIHNAISMDQFLQVPDHSPDIQAPPLITTVGRLHPQKAQHLLLNAAKIVLQRHPDAKFMIVGQGPLEQDLKQQAEALAISDRVIFAGVRRDIPEVLAQSSIFVLPSLWEGLPLSAVEAMASARPVILTDVGGNRELIQPGVNGLVLPPNNVPALAESLIRLIEDPSQRLMLGRAARERVRHEFSIQNVTRRYESIYERLAKSLDQSRIQRPGAVS